MVNDRKAVNSLSKIQNFRQHAIMTIKQGIIFVKYWKFGKSSKFRPFKIEFARRLSVLQQYRDFGHSGFAVHNYNNSYESKEQI